MREKQLNWRSAYGVSVLGSLMAMQILLGSFLSIQLLMTKITFSFIVTAIMARLFPPRITAGATGLAYLLSMLLFPKFAFFIGFVLTAILTGYTFGLCLYQKKLTVWRIAVASLIVNFGFNLFLNSLWLRMMYGLAWKTLFVTRVPQEIISFVIYVILIQVVLKVLPLSQLTARTGIVHEEE